MHFIRQTLQLLVVRRNQYVGESMFAARRLLCVCIAGVFVSGLSPAVVAQNTNRSVKRKTTVVASKTSATSRAKTESEAYHAFLLIAPRPLHLKLHFNIDRKTPSAALNACVADLSKRLDTNKNGKLSREEFNRSPLVRKIVRKKAAKFLKSLGPQPAVKPDEIRKQVWKAAGGSPVIVRTNTSTATYDSGIFDLLDTDQSGLLEPAEMEQAEQILSERDTDFDQVLAFDEFTQTTTEPNDLLTMEDPVGATQSDLMILTSAITRLRAEFFKRYDEDRNRRLSAAELDWPASHIKQLDRNNDQLLSSLELANLATLPVDIELSVSISTNKDATPKTGDTDSKSADSAVAKSSKTSSASAETSQPEKKQRETEITVLNVQGRNADNAKIDRRSGVVSVNCQNVKLRLAVRPIDPIQSAIDNAMQGFNQLDMDGNGYLGKDEVSQRIRMARGLFDMIDTDGDEKIFAKEMTAYIQFAGAPIASTVRVDVFDTGYGFFQNLDANQDGRLSVRELRTVSDSLAKMERDNVPGLSTTEPVRNYYIEFGRGSFRLFGQRSQLATPTATGEPSFVRNAVDGPIWFQRMDRNNDGDLTWEEFLGPRSVFDLLDADKDELIDPAEATEAGVD